jgi:hypothetical protein
MLAESSTRPSRFDDFKVFAKEIYKTPAPIIPYLWPALYGGEAEPDHDYEVLFVFQRALPRCDVWRTRWSPNSECDSTTNALWTHRCMFFEWARSNPLTTDLFELFGRQRRIEWARSSSSTELFDLSRRASPIVDFYKRFYITDLWKDYNPERKDYWLCTLRVELQCVPTQCVVFAGSEAKTHGPKRLEGRVPHYCVAFPSRQRVNDFRASFAKLRQRLIDDHRIPPG